MVVPARGQAVISTRSGLVHFFEGSVYVAGQPLEARLGKFASIPEGGELRTEQGRAEVLLTPGVFLRVNEASAIRMISNALSDTRVEVVAGSAMVDSVEPAAGTSVTLTYKGWIVHQPGKGAYRIDCDPPRVWVREGEAEVSTAGGGAPVSVGRGMDLPFAAVLVPERSNGESHDALSDWADGRTQSIAADNAIAANIEDPASMSGSDFPMDTFTYFPMLGYPAYSMSLSNPYGALGSYPSGVYGSSGLYQSGFYSIYLPGYTRPPLLLGLPVGRLPVYGAPIGIGVSRFPIAGSPIMHPVTPRPVTVSRPVTGSPMPRGTVHAGAHR
jgi:hypothetical protein